MIKARSMSNSCIQCLSISKSDFTDLLRLIQDLYCLAFICLSIKKFLIKKTTKLPRF